MTSAELDRLLVGPPFAGLDAEFAALLERMEGGSRPELRLAAALVSRRRSEGQVCLDLAMSSGVAVENDAGATVMAPSLNEWQTALGRSSGVVGGPGELKPLVLEGHRLYWRRYWDYEQRLATALQTRVQATPEAVEVPRLREGLKRLFPSGASDEPDWQQVAAFLVVRHRLTVILGGPGTGKTRTVARALALLFELQGPTLRVAVAAPTGKAAARLQATIRRAKVELGAVVPALGAMSDEVKTVHRLLKVNPATGRPHFDAANPLPLDILVVDEASMVDLALMTKLVSALPVSARLVLLGDKDQLAAVEAGSVLGDLAAGRESNRYSSGLSAAFAETTGIALPVSVSGAGASPLADCFVELRANHRFGTDSGIYRASQCVNNGDAVGALRSLRHRAIFPQEEARTEGEALWQELPGRTELRRALRHTVRSRFGLMCGATDPLAALQAMETFRILAAVRSGPFGVEGLNLLIVDLLREAGTIGGGPWYSGRQVLVTANDPEAGLFNGDLGVVLIGTDGTPAVWFSDVDGAPRRVTPSRLPPHETAFALTVHKSQGSEFDEVLLILPERPSPVVTRELVYTGLTRARRRTEIWSREGAFREAVSRRTDRASGLRERLWGI
jgi:exodeoxyribonuclease V alpha subunit